MAEKEVRLIDVNAFYEKHKHYGLQNGTVIGKHSGMAEYLLDELMKAPTIDPESLRPQWHNAETDPPKEPGEYIVTINGAKCSTTLHYDNGDWFDIDNVGFVHYAVSHWMPMPEPPEEE